MCLMFIAQVRKDPSEITKTSLPRFDLIADIHMLFKLYDYEPRSCLVYYHILNELNFCSVLLFNWGMKYPENKVLSLFRDHLAA